ncbi:MAG: methylated-DNA--[protein]-cysteine S-methyltransferase [Bacteroidia bacterium]|nr:methylated-DNA--[protein]-cysteine S-methyltransferase [Bacteroidia bacterium]
MKEQDYINYQRIEKAIIYLTDNFKQQPSLEEVAAHTGLSPFYFQKLFSDWAGVSPKKFLEFLSVEYAKSVLKKKELILFDAAESTGLSGTGRLHDLFVNIERMTPGEYKNGGAGLNINYSFSETLFGKVFVASTNKGVCRMVFTNDEGETISELKKDFHKALLLQQRDSFQNSALKLFDADWNNFDEIKLHLKGSDFQIKVWQCLLQIPFGELSSYGKIAERIHHPKASRAVGTAIGDNPIAYLIPCHRVVQSGGQYGQYRWGSARKKLLIGWEAAKSKGE